MGTTVLHLGGDSYNRRAVLNSTGFDVLELECVPDNFFEQYRVAAILVDEEGFAGGPASPDTVDPNHILPRVLFRSSERAISAENYDLVVPQGSSPSEWLPIFRSLLTRSREIREQSKSLRQASEMARDASRSLRQESQTTQNEFIKTQNIANGMLATRNTVEEMAEVPKVQEWLRLAAQGAQMGLWYWDETNCKLFWDAKAREMFGVPAEGEVTLDTFYQALHPEDRERVKNKWRYELEQGKPYHVDFRSLLPDGSSRWIHARGSGYYDEAGKPLRMVGVVFDVTERKESERRQAELSGRLIGAQENERGRLARELHDDFSQRMALLANELLETEKMIADSSPEGAQRVHEIWATASEIGIDLHSLSHRLHSTTLDALGLVAAIQSHCREIGRKHGLQIEIVHEEVPKLMDPEIALCLFRIAQEALRNVSKHSQASKAEIRLQGSKDAISLTLSDNGVGVSLVSLAAGGIGIQSMSERARLLGGTFALESAPLQGTQILVTIPLKGREQAA